MLHELKRSSARLYLPESGTYAKILVLSSAPAVECEKIDLEFLGPLLSTQLTVSAYCLVPLLTVESSVY
jgi:hypothetical protein